VRSRKRDLVAANVGAPAANVGASGSLSTDGWCSGMNGSSRAFRSPEREHHRFHPRLVVATPVVRMQGSWLLSDPAEWARRRTPKRPPPP
jgi:hypothetical protein